MKNASLISVFIVLSLLTSCAHAPYTQNTYNTQYSSSPKQKPNVLHEYEILVVDVNGDPLSDVKVNYELTEREKTIEKNSYITKSDGKVFASYSATSDPQYEYTSAYNSDFTYRAIKDGYYASSGKLSIFETDGSNRPPESETITLIRPIDYFNKKFATTLSDTKLKVKILNFIDLIILQGLLSESVLETQSINLQQFKNNSYLQFKFTSENVYNSLKLNKYDIGKRLFDEVVRKVLSPLNEYIAESKLFYGYDLTIVGYTKSFAEEYEKPEPIIYRFILPEKVVRKYKNKDISGQQVLDASVILMNDERIELKLQ